MEISFKILQEITLSDRSLVKWCSQRKDSSFCRTWNWNFLGWLCCAVLKQTEKELCWGAFTCKTDHKLWRSAHLSVPPSGSLPSFLITPRLLKESALICVFFSRLTRYSFHYTCRYSLTFWCLKILLWYQDKRAVEMMTSSMLHFCRLMKEEQRSWFLSSFIPIHHFYWKVFLAYGLQKIP